MDLFASAVEERLSKRAPLAARLRPRKLDEVVGQRHLLGEGKPLRVLIESDRLSSVVLWGPAGTGKTSVARLVAGATSKSFETLSAVNAGVKDVREVVERARDRLGQQGRGTILFLDEVHRFNRTQQDALLPHVEDGLLVLIGATTENPYFSLTGPLLSRSTLFRLDALEPADLVTLLERALGDRTRGLGDEPAEIEREALEHLATRAE
ncbi:MAG TPA: AAA family ATPase, partial [Acidimicrobiia bacterium]